MLFSSIKKIDPDKIENMLKNEVKKLLTIIFHTNVGIEQYEHGCC